MEKTEFKGTKIGTACIKEQEDGYLFVHPENQTERAICRVYLRGNEITDEDRTNAQTIATGLNLAQRFGSLEELERQRNEAISIIKACEDRFELLFKSEGWATSGFGSIWKEYKMCEDFRTSLTALTTAKTV